MSVVHEVLPECIHRMCCHHIVKKLLQKFRVEGLKEIFWDAAKSTNMGKYQLAMEKLRAKSQEAFHYLSQIDVRSWFLYAMDFRVKVDHITSNFVESFNAWIGEERYKPPITMLEHIRTKIMDLLFSKNQINQNWPQLLPPDVLGRLKSLTRVSRYCEVIRGSRYEFEVSLNEKQVAVNLDLQICGCRA